MVSVAASPVEIGGLPIPDGRPVFLAFLGVHIAAGLWCVVTGAAAALARKCRGRHPRLGDWYVGGFGVLLGSLSVLAVLRWPETVHLLVIGLVSTSAAGVGLWARRRRPPRWVAVHGTSMAVSYIGLLTGFLVDNGPLLPGWRELPHGLYWVLPALVGAPLLVRALARYQHVPTPPAARAPFGAD